MTRVLTALILLGFLASCGALGRSRLNPVNWFGKSRSTPVVQVTPSPPKDTRPLVGTVLSLKVDRMPGGAIIHAVGLPATEGYWGAALVALNAEKPDKGVLKYEFRLTPPPETHPVGIKRTREVLVGHFVSDQKLSGVRRIEVIGAANRRITRR